MSSAKKNVKRNQPKYNVPSFLVDDMKFLEKSLDNDMLFRKCFYQLINQQYDPLSRALELLVALKLGSKKKANKLNVAVEIIENWCEAHNLQNLLSPAIKANAIKKAVILSNEIITKKICAIFQLQDEKEYMKHVIRSLLSEKKFNSASYFMSALNLEQEFTLEEFAFPAFLLDHENLVKSYLLKCPHLQIKFVKTLDSLFQNVYAIQEFARSLNIGGLDKNKPFYNPKWMKKRLPTYIDFLKIDLRECPNVYFARAQGAMYYLIRKRYTEETIEPEAFEELVADLVSDEPSLQRELLVKLVCVNDSTAAHILARTLNLNFNQLPDCLRAIPSPSEEFMSLYYRGSQLKHSSDFLSLRLSQSDIHIVDTVQSFFDAVDDVSDNYDVVGIDAEWKPNLGIIDTKLALLQIAVWDVIYLFDIQTLNKILSKNQWDYIFSKLFHNREILKLGYGLDNDLTEFIKVIEFEKENFLKCAPLVDLLKVFAKLKHNYPDVLNASELSESSASDDETNSKGLSQLCKVVLGKPLNKGEQFSNWERRPLRETQKLYAALDAYCILMIYEKLYHILKNLNLTLDQFIAMPLSTISSKEKSPNQKNSKPIAVEEFKIVTDCMLNGLGKYLRMFGADVFCLNEGDDPRCALEIAQSERRIILTCGNRYEKLKGYMPENMIFCVNNKVDLKRQVAELQNHFNLKLDESVLFSRCSICNGCNFLTVKNETLYSLWCNLVDDDTKGLISTTKKRSLARYECDITTADGLVKKSVSVQLATVSAKVFETVMEFLICEGCGKIYWNGSHLSRLKDSVSSVIEIKPSKKNFYEEHSRQPSKTSPDKSYSVTDLKSESFEPEVSSKCSNSVVKKIYSFPEDDSSEEELDDIVY